MGIKDKLKDFISADYDDDKFLELDEEEAQAISKYEEPRSRAVSDSYINKSMVLFEPRSYDESQEIAMCLKRDKACVVNLHRLSRDYAQRTLDFLTGVLFALDGTIQKVGPNVVLCAPKSMGVGGKITTDGTDGE